MVLTAVVEVYQVEACQNHCHSEIHYCSLKLGKEKIQTQTGFLELLEHTPAHHIVTTKTNQKAHKVYGHKQW